MLFSDNLILLNQGLIRVIKFMKNVAIKFVKYICKYYGNDYHLLVHLAFGVLLVPLHFNIGPLLGRPVLVVADVGFLL